MSNKLNPRQQAFLNNLMKGMSQKEAYVSAGYSPKTAEQNSTALIRNPKFRANFEAAKERAANKAEATLERVLREECRIAFADIIGLFDENGALVRPQDIPEDLRRAIASIKVIEKWDPESMRMLNVYEYRFWDKGRALERIGKHLGMYEKDNEQKRPALDEVFAAIAAVSPKLAEAIKERIANRSA